MKVFFDTNLFIYLWEKNESPRAGRIRRILRTLRAGDGALVTSTLSLAEILVHPMRAGAAASISKPVRDFEALDAAKPAGVVGHEGQAKGAGESGPGGSRR